MSTRPPPPVQIRAGDYYTAEGAAAVLGLSIVRVRQLLVKERLPGVRVGRTQTWLVHARDLAAFARVPRPAGRPPRAERLRSEG